MKYLLALGLIAAAFALTCPRRFDSAKVFRVKPQNERQVSFLKYLASKVPIEFWYPDSASHIANRMQVDFLVNAQQSDTVKTLLEQNSLHYQILFENVQEEIDKQLERNSLDNYSYTKYNEWHKISAWTARIAEKKPKLIFRLQIGKTFENRPMYVLQENFQKQVGKQNSIKRAIFMDCGIHAREWISPAFCQWFVKEAIRTYGKDEAMTKLLDNMNFYVLPVFNIDGYIWSWTSDRCWRKNRSNVTSNQCIGVDLNRNFDAAWGTVDSSKNPCTENFCGPSAESEPETKAVATFIRRHLSSIKAYLSIHSYSQMILFPYGYTLKQAPNHAELNELAMNASKAIASLYGKEYKYGTSALTIYPSSGCSDDWAYDQGIKYSFTFELRDKGRYGFFLPESEIKPTCQEIMLAVKCMASYILSRTM